MNIQIKKHSLIKGSDYISSAVTLTMAGTQEW